MSAIPLTTKPSEQIAAMGLKPQSTPQSTQGGKTANIREALAKSSLSVTAPGRKAMRPLSGAFVMMDLTQLDTYERNPRKAKNDKYEDLALSIRTTKQLDGPIPVAWREDRQKYVCTRGANTRLHIVQALYEEDPVAFGCFAQIMVQVENWSGHASAIANHIKENTLRAEMTYFDKARGIYELAAELRDERGKAVGLSELERILLQEFGIKVDKGSLSRYLHCAEYFGALAKYLNQLIAKELVPLSRDLEQLSQVFGIAHDEYWDNVGAELEHYVGGLTEGGGVFATEAVQSALKNTCAVLLSLNKNQFDLALAAFKINPKAKKEELLAAWREAPIAALQTPGKADGGDSERDYADNDPDEVSPDEVSVEPAPSTTAIADKAVVPERGDDDTDTASSQIAAQSQNFDTVMHATVQAAQQLAQIADIEDWIVTDPMLACGFYADMVNAQQLGIPMLTESGKRGVAPQKRIACWWLMAALNKQTEREALLLLPANCAFRQIWTEGSDVFDDQTPNVFDVAQDYLGAVMSDAAQPAIQIEHLNAFFTDRECASAFGRLAELVAQLRIVRAAQ